MCPLGYTPAQWGGGGLGGLDVAAWRRPPRPHGDSGTERAMQPSPQQRPEPAAAGRVLLIDDEQRVLRFVTKGLRAEGFVTDAADSGAEGLRKALAADWDLIILDLLMPGTDGEAVLRGILAERPAQPVLVLSCLSATEAKVRCFEAGADDYLIKPFSLDEIGRASCRERV